MFINEFSLFQFLYGAIGSRVEVDQAKYLVVFQFLYGAIGRGNPLGCLTVVIVFQFLYGAIGRFEGVLGNAPPSLYFNSYMVLLEVDTLIIKMSYLSYFNY